MQSHMKGHISSVLLRFDLPSFSLLLFLLLLGLTRVRTDEPSVDSPRITPYAVMSP